MLRHNLEAMAKLDAACWLGAYLRPEFEQLGANGRDGGIDELAVAQTNAAQGIDETYHGCKNDMRS